MNEITKRARELRQASTPSEIILWDALRNNQLDGWKFVRQKPFICTYMGKRRKFYVDFYCKEGKLIIEVDGSIHLLQRNYDKLRTTLLKTRKLHVIRFTNESVINELPVVLDQIRLELYNIKTECVDVK